MAKGSARDRSSRSAGGTASQRARLFRMAMVVVVVGAAAGLLVRTSRQDANPQGAVAGFKEVGRNGPVFTVSVPRAKTADEEYLMKIAEQLSARDVQAGASGQVSVMVWPDDVPVPKEPPTTEFDASMKTQAAGIFINPKLNVKHLIRFKDGQTVSEREFGNGSLRDRRETR
jgi:hypothetical protein